MYTIPLWNLLQVTKAMCISNTVLKNGANALDKRLEFPIFFLENTIKIGHCLPKNPVSMFKWDYFEKSWISALKP